MKQFKNIFIFGIIVLFLVGVMIIREAAPSRTVDFRGEVHTVKTLKLWSEISEGE